VLAANLPDLDFLPGIVIGQPGAFHHGPSHSIAFAVLFGTLVGAFAQKRRLYAFVISALLYLSHVFLDFLVDDPSFPHGVPLFWPFSDAFFMASPAIFPKFDYASHSLEFFGAVFTVDNFVTVITEIGYMFPVFVLVSHLRRTSARS
jgi:inner membrane protein